MTDQSQTNDWRRSPKPFHCALMGGIALCSGIAVFMNDPIITKMMGSMLIGWTGGLGVAVFFYADWRGRS